MKMNIFGIHWNRKHIWTGKNLTILPQVTYGYFANAINDIKQTFNWLWENEN